MKSWPFQDQPNVAVLTTRTIIDGSEWIAYVSHDADDGDWQFHGPGAGPAREADGAVVGLGEIVELDESVAELADLPLGWHAWRVSEDAPWQRSRTVRPD